MEFWRTLFNRQTKPIKPTYPVIRTPPVIMSPTVVTVAQTPLPVAPALTANPSISSTDLNVGTVATATHGTYTGTVTGYTPQWYSGASAISGANSLTYTYQSSDIGNNVTYRESAYNTSPTYSSATGTSNALGPVTSGGLGGSGTLSAPVVGYPTPQQAYTSPAAVSISVQIGADWQSGDVFKLYKSASANMASPTLVGTHTLSDSDVAGGSFSVGIGTLSAITYLQAFGSHSGTDSQYLSNVVGWGSVTAPTFTSAATFSQVELFPLSFTVTTNETCTLAITGGADQLQYSLSGSTLEWFNNGTENYDIPADADQNNTYIVQITATDLFGNTANQTITGTVTAASKVPTLTPSGFTAQTNATDGTVYTSNSVTVSGLTSGLSIPVACSGTNFTYSKNGGAYGTASGTVQNGDTLTMQGKTTGGTATGTLTFNSGTTHQSTATYSIQDNAVGLSTTNKNSSLTLNTSTPPLQWTTSSGNGSSQGVVADTPKTPAALVQWECTITTVGNGFEVGFCDGSSIPSFTTNPSPTPGRSGQPNGSIFFTNTTTYFSDYNGTSTGSTAITLAAGDVMTMLFDPVGHTMKYFRNGTVLVTQTGTNMTTICPYFGSESQGGSVGTVNFGQTAFAYPQSGAIAYQSA